MIHPDLKDLFEIISNIYQEVSGDTQAEMLAHIYKVMEELSIFSVGPPQRTEELTPSQREALRAFINFVESDDRYFRLTGYAGTGKTYLITHFVEYLQAKNFRFCLCSPTNKAARNLANALQLKGFEEEVITLARLLRLRPVIDLSSGKEVFLPDEENEVDLSRIDLVICDEFSMISQENFNMLEEQVLYHGLQIIFVGDDAQLPPVGEDISVIAKHQNMGEIRLTEIVRYDGEIARVAENIRSLPQYKTQIYPFCTTTDKTINKLAQKQWMDKAIGMFLESKSKNPDYCRMIAWRNATVDKFNKYIRESIFGPDCDQYIPGERLIAKRPLFRKHQAFDKWEPVVENSEEMVIEERIEVRPTPDNYNYYAIPVITESGKRIVLQVLTPDSDQDYQSKLKEIAKKAKEARTDKDHKKCSDLWRRYYDLEKRFDAVSYCYCLTCHKAQGSSLDYIFIYVKDILYNPDKQKWTYTALTRARKTAFIC